MAKYSEGLKSGLYRPDPRQRLTIQMLQELYDDLQRAGASHQLPGHHHHRPRRRPSGLTIVDHVGPADDEPSVSGRGGGGGGSAFSWFSSLGRAFGGGGNGGGIGGGNGGSGDLGRGAPAPGVAHAVRGLYMYGGVGCGKTMLMDLFVHTAPPHFKVWQRLGRLFGRLWDKGLVLVATSNRAPDELYKGGLQRNLFMPFIHRLKEACRPHDMESSTDYRRLAQHQQGLYFVAPPGATRGSAPSAGGQGAGADPLGERFSELADGAEPGPTRVEVMMGRSLEVPVAAGKACLFAFPDLCGRPLGAADYLALAGSFHTLALRGVPVFGAANRTEAYRFVTLIDVLYEARTRLLVTAEAPPVDLFANIITQFDAAKRPELAARPEVVVDDNLGFAKERTISRLTEMQSIEYLMHHARQHEPSLVLALQEAHAKVRGAAAAAGH
ncbi:hypothetical protein GPECTOR_65g205 [Gonium pectorale]|uniref:ATPase n=1 Tax=Gonium pectorale TaxID=33097 RepID=A0A150G405_GONPE|nr:hypothetical protein GPECTOR_65g205 [Gonium pectorale]|eukprot:KXZ44587.1 hypothetical protein GPECTOR_65g205 [Gonium pectorale]